MSQMSPSKIAMCIIDEVAEFEGAYQDWVDGICLVVDQLKCLVHHHDGTRKLKVLMTSANKSLVVSSRVKDEEAVALSGYGILNHSTRWTMTSNSDVFLSLLFCQHAQHGAASE